MSKIAKTVFILIPFYVIPLLGKPALVLDFRILILMAVCAVLLLTQPELKPSEAKETAKSDRYSVWVILAAAGLTQIISVVEWGYFRNAAKPPNWAWVSTGLALLLGGTVFRIWSIRILGRFFTATVQTSTEQKLVTAGPYAIIRHPSYLGAYLAYLGSAILLQAVSGALFAAIAGFWAYWFRISVEEKALAGNFGEIYREYQNQTKKMIPWVW